MKKRIRKKYAAIDASGVKEIAEMQRYVGEGCAFSVEYVDGFQELKNGKRRYFMNDLSHE